MNYLNFLFTFFFIYIVCACLTACSSNVDEELIQSREVSKQLGAQLKNKLVSAMQDVGAEAAISVCNLEAIEITADVSKNNNLEIGRTSLQIRNPLNQPDEWELEQMLWFKTQSDSGIDIKTLETHEVVKKDGKKIFRYMKAILVQEPCMLCHGVKLASPIEEKIKNLYPQDQATGYQVGQVRGAFTIKKSL